jgi:hypothetical protein
MLSVSTFLLHLVRFVERGLVTGLFRLNDDERIHFHHRRFTRSPELGSNRLPKHLRLAMTPQEIFFDMALQYENRPIT